MTQIYPNIPSTEAVSDSRQMLLDRDNAVKTDFAGTDYPEVTEDDIGMVCYRTDLKDAFRYIGNDTEGNPIWQREVPADNIRSIKQDITEETFYIDLPEGEVVDSATSVWVNIDDRLLNSSEYTITNEGTRITFTEPLQPSSVAEIRWVTRIKVARDGATFVPTLKDGVLSWDNNQNLPNPEDFDFNEAQKNVTAEGDKQVARVEKAGENIVQTATNSQIWAEGTDEEVQALGGIHSSKGWAEANENLNYQDITNCITKIPQDIKLELSNGTLTLKAGSKVYVPNGVGKFDEFVIASDITVISSVNNKMLVFINNSKKLQVNTFSNVFSRKTAPTGLTSGINYIWYDTTNNIVKLTTNAGSSWTSGFSLPLCLITGTGSITSIDQVFNGFGYIGSTIFALPGVEGLIPNGRNTDGSLNNIKFTTTNVKTFSPVQRNSNTLMGLSANGFNSEPLYYYDNENNFIINGSNGIAAQRCIVMSLFLDSTGRITSFNPKPCFHAVDYYDFKQLDDNTVHKTGNEEITGIKTFIQGDIRGRTSTSTSSAIARYACFDKDGVQYSDVWITRSEQGNSNGISWAGFRISNSSGSVPWDRSLAIMKSADSDTIKTQAPTPPASDNSTQIATTAWVKANSYAASGANYVKLADGTIIQWGKGTYDTTVPLPTPFSSTNYTAFIIDTSVTSNAVTNHKTTSFDYKTNYGSNRHISWVAIGR